MLLFIYGELISLWRPYMSTFYGLGSGDEASFNLLSKIENQADHVIRFAFSLTLNNEDAEKLCWDFGKLYKRFGRCRC